jgi:YidC/Oxa1 family membrane protein insertase
MDFIAKPFGWLLMALYELTKNYGAAILLFALVVKVVLLYFSAKSKKSIMRSTRFTPYLKELEAKYEGNKQKYQEEVSRLYKEEHINPMGGCLWSLLPFPILLALYRAIRFPITIMMGVPAEAYEKIKNVLYAMGYEAAGGLRSTAYAQIFESQFITQHFERFAHLSEKLRTLDYSFLGMNLGEQPNWRFWTFGQDGAALWPQLGLFLIPVLSAVLSWLQSKISQDQTPQTNDQAAGSTKTMMMIMPIMSLWIGFAMPGALGLYWIAGSVLQIIQDVVLGKIFNKQLDAEDAERNARLRAREQELERKRQETERLRAEGATTVNPNTSRRKMQKSEKQKAEQRSAEWQAANNPGRKKGGEEPSRVGERAFARGRAYVPNRFDPDYVLPDEPEETIPELPDEPELPTSQEISAGEIGAGEIDAGEIGDTDAHSENNGE